MTEPDFESFLDLVVKQLNADVRKDKTYHDSRQFEERVLDVMVRLAEKLKIKIEPTFHPHAFPDIKANGFGVEVKSTRQDNWRSVGNSVLESMRDSDVERIYIVFGKMGGLAGVAWGRYEEVIKHVRITHAPRFEIEMKSDRGSLFDVLKIAYPDFAILTRAEKMNRVRQYARGRLKPGERLWWLEDEHALDLQVKRFSSLSDGDKLKMRAETAILCPEIVKPSRTLNKYDAALHFLITYRGVLAGRDMFSAGSVGMKDGVRGGNHILRGLADIQDEMKDAAQYLEPALFREYWPTGIIVPSDVNERLRKWLEIADEMAMDDNPPSKTLFTRLG